MRIAVQSQVVGLATSFRHKKTGFKAQESQIDTLATYFYKMERERYIEKNLIYILYIFYILSVYSVYLLITKPKKMSIYVSLLVR